MWKTCIVDTNIAVSNLGRVKYINKNSEFPYFQNYSGCRMISVRKGRRDHKNYRVHRLVATAFLVQSENDSYVKHKDGNKLNNNILNLYWVQKSRSNKNFKRLFLQICGLTGRILNIFESWKEAAHSAGCSTGSISKCCSGKIPAVKGFKWERFKFERIVFSLFYVFGLFHEET